MAPTASPPSQPLDRDRTSSRVGPHPSYIEVAKPYMLQSRIQKCLSDLPMSDAKEDTMRLQGVAYIDQVRRALQLPVRTFNTAVIYYHKFRLLHKDDEYNYADAAAAALFTACKIEDTLKKSREILAAYWNLKVGVGEQLSSDDPRFENHSKLIIGLERLMLESASFDFRNRYPQKLMVKLARELGLDRNNVAKTAWNLSIDLYRTFAPLKQTTPTLAIACLELAARLHEIDPSKVVDTGAARYSKWNTSRAEVMETLLDLLDLYTPHRQSTSVGPLYSIETFINIRITLNQEASSTHIPRYASYASDGTTPESQTSAFNGLPKPRNGIDPISPLTPATPSTISPGTTAHPPTSAIGVRGQNGTVRFMLDVKRAHDERAEVERFWKVEEEEYEVEVEVPNEPERERDRDRIQDRDRERDRERERDWDRRRDDTGFEDWLKSVAVPSEGTGGRGRGRGRGEGRGRGTDKKDSHRTGRQSSLVKRAGNVGTVKGRGRGNATESKDVEEAPNSVKLRVKSERSKAREGRDRDRRGKQIRNRGARGGKGRRLDSRRTTSLVPDGAEE